MIYSVSEISGIFRKIWQHIPQISIHTVFHFLKSSAKFQQNIIKIEYAIPINMATFAEK